MQRMGGGSCPCSGGLLKGGGNNPSCGCDMQAGWPSASVLPRGGTSMQGGKWNFNEFNLALTKNGRTRHLRGRWNNNRNSNRRTNNTNNNNGNGDSRISRITSAPSTLSFPSTRRSGSTRRSRSSRRSRSTRRTPRSPLYAPQSPQYAPQTPPYGSQILSGLSQPQSPAYEPVSPQYEPVSPIYSVGGRKTKKHGKRCSCFTCMFKKMKL